MKLIVGLGNPGKRYARTRHNAGFILLDKLAEKVQKDWQKSGKFNSEVIQTKSLILAKPTTYMNESGKAVSSLASYYKVSPSDIYVAHDDLDLRIGAYKIQKGVGPKEHKGIESINKALGTADYWRIRMGVDNRSKENRIDGETYVLQKFTPVEMKSILRIIDTVIVNLKKAIMNLG